MNKIKKYCKVRKDLIEQGIAVPIGNNKYYLTLPIEYRWVGEDEDEFEVKYIGEWMSANSIDFEFEDIDIQSIYAQSKRM